MKYSLSSRQSKSILAEADEIRVTYNDKDILLDLAEDYPGKTVIFEVTTWAEFEWDLWKAYAEKLNLILCIQDFSLADECNAHGLKWYWGFAVTTFFELRTVIAKNPAYVRVGVPLCFSLPKIKNITSIPLRMTPNIANEDYLERPNGIYGGWVRPEDIPTYEKYIDTMDFATDDLAKERTLFEVYHDRGEWPGNLNLLFTNFNLNIDNRAIYEDLAESRVKCGQRCMENGTCHLCETAMMLADTLRKKHDELKSK